MQLLSLKVKNYKVLKDITVKNIPTMAVFLGRNGAGKTTLFDVFGFLHDALQTNVSNALSRRGGYKEVLSRGQTGNIEFALKFRMSPREPIITYQLSVGLTEKKHIGVTREILSFRRGQNTPPLQVLHFSNGVGEAVAGEIKTVEDIYNAVRTEQTLDSSDILAIKGLGQFKDFPYLIALRQLIEDWYVSDFHVDEALGVGDIGGDTRLSKTGSNLASVAKHLRDFYPDVFRETLRTMAETVPGIGTVDAVETQDARIVLRFGDGAFKDPFTARFVSDGTIKMFTYLILLADPEKHALLCVEEPENQLYPEILAHLSEEFRNYARGGGQVLISTHSPDFLNAVELDELYLLRKKEGYTTVTKAGDIPQIKAFVDEGDQLGYLWKEGFLDKEEWDT